MQRCSFLVCFFLALGATRWAQGDQKIADEQDDFELVQTRRLKFDTSIADEEPLSVNSEANQVRCTNPDGALGDTISRTKYTARWVLTFASCEKQVSKRTCARTGEWTGWNPPKGKYIYDNCEARARCDSYTCSAPTPVNKGSTVVCKKNRGSCDAGTCCEAGQDMCRGPYKDCAAWGDPHYTASFFGGRFDFMGVGLYQLASSTDGSFEMQGFQVPFGRHHAAAFGGLAMKIDGTTFTFVRKNYTVNGTMINADQASLGLLACGISAGMLTNGAKLIGESGETRNGAFESAGTQNWIKWDILLGIDDFNITSEFKSGRLAGTSLAFLLYDADGNEMTIGLDGVFYSKIANRFFYAGGAWGRTTPLGASTVVEDTFAVLSLVRKAGKLSVSLGGTKIAGMESLPLTESITAVGWRPWRNSIVVKSLCQAVPGHLGTEEDSSWMPPFAHWWKLTIACVLLTMHFFWDSSNSQNDFLQFVHHGMFNVVVWIFADWNKSVSVACFILLLLATLVMFVAISVVPVKRGSYGECFSTGETTTKIHIDNKYQNIDQSDSHVVLVFMAQSILVGYLAAAFLQLETDAFEFTIAKFVNWVCSLFIQHLASDHLGEFFDEEIWHKIQRSTTPMPRRACMDMIVNGTYMALIWITLPLILMNVEGPMDFVKDALAIYYITTLDDDKCEIELTLDDSKWGPKDWKWK